MKHKRFLRKTAFLIVLSIFLVSAVASAFLLKVDVLDKEAIEKLSDEKLVDTYIDAMIELEAADAFYNNSGFTPREYEKYKSVLRFRTDLILEMHQRELEVPKIKY